MFLSEKTVRDVYLFYRSHCNQLHSEKKCVHVKGPVNVISCDIP